jgi:LmbE family N-acetylglucosaminyl deacetylase
VAATFLGVSSVTCLQRADGEFDNDLALRGELVGIIRALRPGVVFGPDPTATFFGGVYVNHRDHRETGWALLDAVAPASAMPLYFHESGAAHDVEHLLLSGTHEPDVAIDVTEAIEDKVKAVLAHSSQVSDDPEWVRHIVLGRAQQAGREIGVAHGEAFRHVALAHE